MEIIEYNDKYLDDVEQAYEAQKLANKITGSINETSSIKNQEKLQALYDKECRLTEFFQNEFSDSNGPFIYDEPLSILQNLLETI